MFSENYKWCPFRCLFNKQCVGWVSFFFVPETIYFSIYKWASVVKTKNTMWASFLRVGYKIFRDQTTEKSIKDKEIVPYEHTCIRVRFQHADKRQITGCWYHRDLLKISFLLLSFLSLCIDNKLTFVHIVFSCFWFLQDGEEFERLNKPSSDIDTDEDSL